MCDAVQTELYEIDGVEVSNFVLPLYFTPGARAGKSQRLSRPRSRTHDPAVFGREPGGYVGFWDRRTKKEDTYFADDEARERMEIKQRAATARRAVRYQSLGDKPFGSRKK